MNDKLPPSLNRFAAELEQAIRRELGSRRDRRLGRVLRARPRLLAGTTVGAAGTGVVLALVLSAAGSSPAFAVSRNRDGSYSVTLRSLRAIPAANAKLARMGVPARFMSVRGTCTNAIAGALDTARLRGAAQSVRVPARSLPRNRLLMIAAWRNARQVKVASSISRAAVACVPPCPPGGAGAKPESVQVPVADGGVNPGNSGNSGNSGSGNSGNSGSGAVSSPSLRGYPARTAQPPAKSVQVPKWMQIQCPAPPPGAGNSGNSGNSGSGNSGNS